MSSCVLLLLLLRHSLEHAQCEILDGFFLCVSDMGNTDNAQKIKNLRFMRKHVTGVAPINVTTVALERGMTWEQAVKK